MNKFLERKSSKELPSTTLNLNNLENVQSSTKRHNRENLKDLNILMIKIIFKELISASQSLVENTQIYLSITLQVKYEGM